MKKQGKRSKKKHLSKEAFRKIRYKQNMWRVYKHTGKDKDYDAYKEHTCQPREKFWRDKRGATERSEPTSEGGPGGPGVHPRKI